MSKKEDKQTIKPESREAIIARVRQNKPEEKPLPESFSANHNPSSKTQLFEQLKQSLIKAGAEIIELAERHELQHYLETQRNGTIDLTNAKIREKYSSGISKEELEKTKTVIVGGQFGVAENGAIWLDESDFNNRLLPFVAEQLVIVLNKENIVANMHTAYQRINLENTGFGVFISGPSKTADIEQSLVYGAHGARTATVVFY
ncbi:LutC/YkgG family protein [Gaoshiqia sp. Z1-71]|uniref:LutC/YkgG family protein n=1 Tax=Gaoshiqia hydrogeniformans TaxID=3290090 RepID=UPI003BF89AC4